MFSDCLLVEVTHVILWSNRYDQVDKYLLLKIEFQAAGTLCTGLIVARAFWGTIPGGVVDFSLFHESNLSDPNPQTADIKSGYRGRESRTNLAVYMEKKLKMWQVYVRCRWQMDGRHAMTIAHS